MVGRMGSEGREPLSLPPGRSGTIIVLRLAAHDWPKGTPPRELPD
jgi:hypothetical protein